MCLVRRPTKPVEWSQFKTVVHNNHNVQPAESHTDLAEAVLLVIVLPATCNSMKLVSL